MTPGKRLPDVCWKSWRMREQKGEEMDSKDRREDHMGCIWIMIIRYNGSCEAPCVNSQKVTLGEDSSWYKLEQEGMDIFGAGHERRERSMREEQTTGKREGRSFSFCCSHWMCEYWYLELEWKRANMKRDENHPRGDEENNRIEVSKEKRIVMMAMMMGRFESSPIEKYSFFFFFVCRERAKLRVTDEQKSEETRNILKIQ